MRLRSGVAAVALLGATATACTSAPREPLPDPGSQAAASPAGMAWSVVELPAGFAASLLVPGPDGGVLVAADGDADGRRGPRLLEVGGGEVRPVPVRAASFYGRRMVWHTIATRGGRVYAVGGRSGGAHGITRWSAWSGTLGPRGRLAEDVQDFETFGGPDAGGLSQLVAPAGHPPILLGSRVSDAGAGLDIALWDDAGGRWLRRPSTGTDLAASDEQQPIGGALALRGAGLLIAGSITSFDGGVRTQAAIWTAPTTEGPWTSHLLPGTGDPASAAVSATCAREGRCLVAGYAGERLAAWTVSATGETSAVDLPAVPVGPTAATVAADCRDGVCVIVVRDPSHDEGHLLARAGGAWREVAPPPGTLGAVATVGGTLWVATGSAAGPRLWTTPVPRA
jgi:hypothetical protein